MNFNEVEVVNYESKWLKGGNYTVKVTEVKSGKSSGLTPYVDITVGSGDGDKMKTANQRFYLKEGTNFQISAAQILRIVAAGNNLDIMNEDDKTKAKAMLGEVTDETTLATKLASVTVGKSFAIHLDEEVVPAKNDKPSWNKAIFGGGNFAVPTSKANTLSTTIKLKDKTPVTVNTATTNTVEEWE